MDYKLSVLESLPIRSLDMFLVCILVRKEGKGRKGRKRRKRRPYHEVPYHLSRT